MSNAFIPMIVGTWEPGGPTLERDQEDIRRVQLGLRQANDFATEMHGDTVWIATNTVQGLGGRTADAAIGSDVLTRLRAGKSTAIDGKQLRHATLQTLQSRNVGGAILALSPTQDLLDAVDSLYAEATVVVVPYIHNIDLWIETWGPYDLIAHERRPQAKINDQEVVAAVDDIIHNHTGVSHPSDKKFAQDAFARLRRRGRSIEPREIRAHILRESGWDVASATALANIAAGRSKAKISG